MRISGLRQLSFFPILPIAMLLLLQGCSIPTPPPSTGTAPIAVAPIEEVPAAKPKSTQQTQRPRNFGKHPPGHTHATAPPSNKRNTPPKRAARPTSKPNSNAPKPSIKRGNRLLAEGKKRQAADTYYRAAFSHESPRRERIILQAAELTAALGETTLTNNYLQRVQRSGLNKENYARYQYVQALSALKNKQANQALGLLPRELRPLSPGLRDKVLLVRDRAIQMGGTALPNYAQQANTNNPTVETPPTLAPQQNQTAATNAPTITPQASEKMAVLLTQTGSLAKVNEEIYQGIQTTQTQQGGRTKLYPITVDTALAQYQQAVSDGADIVVGPLDKSALAAIMRHPNALSVPILSLNYNDQMADPSTLYQFGLSPEDEARQIAAITTGRGRNRAIVMVPESAWGKRLADSFIQVYQARGGQVLSIANYPNSDAGSYLQYVQQALNNAPGANMVFLGASPTQARLMRPLLQAQAGMLPVYATSHIYSGRPEPSKNIDLDGIIYTEIPMILNDAQSGNLDTLKYPRLYAMGADAAMIAKNLNALTQRQILQGKTGDIRLGPNRAVQRRLDLATFINGVPNPLE